MWPSKTLSLHSECDLGLIRAIFGLPLYGKNSQSKRAMSVSVRTVFSLADGTVILWLQYSIYAGRHVVPGL